MQTRALLTLVVAGSIASAALAQPKLVSVPVISDLSGNGNTVTGFLYDAALGQNVPVAFTRGSGFTRLPGKAPGGGSALCVSGDGTVFASAMDNLTNWGSLNCFAGYTSTGALATPTSPCTMRSIAHRYTQATGWVNAGSLPRYIDAATGRWIGGTSCDATVNSVNDLSDNGRFIVGGAILRPRHQQQRRRGLGLVRRLLRLLV
ncbi:MAG: hypothetical protein QM783_00435 [Phycisphaerales bacterium]